MEIKLHNKREHEIPTYRMKRIFAGFNLVTHQPFLNGRHVSQGLLQQTSERNWSINGATNLSRNFPKVAEDKRSKLLEYLAYRYLLILVIQCLHREKVYILLSQNMQRAERFEIFFYIVALAAGCCISVLLKLNETNFNGDCLLFGKLDILTNNIFMRSQAYCNFTFYSSLTNAILAILLGFGQCCCSVHTYNWR